MKKSGILIVVSCVMVFGLLAFSVNSTVSAYGTTGGTVGTTTTTTTDQPSWVVTGDDGSESVIPQDQITVAPPTDQQLMSPGLVITGSTKICYPFRGGQFGWVGQIRMLSGNRWVSIPTTTKWTPSEEGQLLTCATAPAAGTYALFAYWVAE